MTQWDKNLPAMQETQEMWAQSLGVEYPLGKGMATHSSILAWRALWIEETGMLQSIDRVTKSQRQLSMHAHSSEVLIGFSKLGGYA